MMHKLVKTERGKDTVVMVDQLTKVNARLKTLRASSRGKKVKFEVVPATENDEKYKLAPADQRRWG